MVPSHTTGQESLDGDEKALPVLSAIRRNQVAVAPRILRRCIRDPGDQTRDQARGPPKVANNRRSYFTVMAFAVIV